MYIYLNLPHDLAQMLFPTYMYMYMGKVYGGKRNFVMRYIRNHENKGQCNYES